MWHVYVGVWSSVVHSEAFEQTQLSHHLSHRSNQGHCWMSFCFGTTGLILLVNMKPVADRMWDDSVWSMMWTGRNVHSNGLLFTCYLSSARGLWLSLRVMQTNTVAAEDYEGFNLIKHSQCLCLGRYSYLYNILLCYQLQQLGWYCFHLVSVCDRPLGKMCLLRHLLKLELPQKEVWLLCQVFFFLGVCLWQTLSKQ